MNKKWFFIEWYNKLGDTPWDNAEVFFLTDEEISEKITSETGGGQGCIRKVVLFELSVGGEKIDRSDLVKKSYRGPKQ